MCIARDSENVSHLFGYDSTLSRHTLYLNVHQVFCGGFGRKNIAKIVSGAEQMKNTPIRVFAKPVFVG
jgi:hypothetical protein